MSKINSNLTAVTNLFKPIKGIFSSLFLLGYGTNYFLYLNMFRLPTNVFHFERFSIFSILIK